MIFTATLIPGLGAEFMPQLEEGNLWIRALLPRTVSLVTKMKDAVAKDKEVRAIISADQSLNYGKVMGLIDLVKEAGIAKFALNIQKDAAPVPTGK